MALLLPLRSRCRLVLSSTLALAGLLLALALPAAAAPRRDLWLHVAVDGGGAAGSRVRVTVPLALAQAILPLIDDDDICRGKVRIDGGGFTGSDLDDLRALRAAVAAAKEGEFVRLRLDDADALVARSGGNLLMRVNDGDTRVRIRLPLDLLDALLAAESAGHGEIDLAAAIETLGNQGAGEIVSVDDGTDQVRIWLDTKPDQD